MANNMAELARNMEELDKESAILYGKLGKEYIYMHVYMYICIYEYL
jgi:hypothetical protein